MSPLISVIITTKNEEANIENCLKSILAQTYLKELIEIIVVDNNSTDKTKEIVSVIASRRQADHSSCHSRVGGNPESLKIKLFNHGPERSAQRNYGVEQSSGEYFLYLDADMTLSPGVIKECVDKFPVIARSSNDEAISFPNLTLKLEKSDNLIALYIPEIVMGKKFFSKVRRFERSFYDGTVIDCARFIKKDIFLEVRGFDERMYACEDWDLTKKIKRMGRVLIINSALYHNEAEFDLEEYLSKKEYYLKNMDVYIKKWGKNDSDVKKQFGFWYRFFGVFLEKGKWRRMLTNPILVFGMYFLRGLIGLKYLKFKI